MDQKKRKDETPTSRNFGEKRGTRHPARALDSIGREAGRAALRKIMAQTAEHKLISDHPAELAGQFSGLLWRDLLLSLLLGVAARPKPREIEVHARNTAAAFTKLH